MQVQKRMEPGVRKGKRSLLECHIYRKIETCRKPIKVSPVLRS